MVARLIHLLRRAFVLGSDFSQEGFVLRESLSDPTKLFSVPRMWIGNMGWKSGIKENIVRCYPDGFSFWRGKISERKEWFCEYSAVVGYKKPLGISFANSIVIIRTGDSTIECMLGEAADYIEDLAPKPPEI